MEDCTTGSSLVNHEAWFQNLWWRTHERKCNSWGFEKKARMEDCTRGSSLVNHEAWLQTHWVEDACTKTQLMGLRKKGEDGGLP